VESDKYWAAIEDPAEFGAELKAVIEGNAKASIVQTIREEQRNAFLQLHPINLSGQGSASRIMSDGQEGELAVLRIPKAQRLAEAVVNIITAQKVAWQCQAGKRDADSREATALGNQALEFYWHDKGGESFLRELVSQGVPFGECFGFIEYDDMAGDIVSVAPDESDPGAPAAMKPVYEGDIRFNTVSSWDTARDSRVQSWEDSTWMSFCLRRNKYDLAAKFGPEVLDACKSLDKGILPLSDGESTKSDLVDCWYFFHKRTPAVPLGRQAVLIGDKVFALDHLRYRRVPVVRFQTGKLTGTPFPCAPFWSALASQELSDSLWSAIATNNLALGTQMVAVTAGSEFEPDSVGPMRQITVPLGGMEPKPIQLTQSAPESFKVIDMVDVAQKQQLGLNNTVLGQPDHAGQSGASQALLSSMAMQANSSPQATYIEVIKETGNIVVEIFQDFFSTEHKIRIAGKAMGYMARAESFKGEQLKPINGVSVRVGNPLAQTIAGREAILDKYIQIQKDSGGEIKIIRTAEDIQQLYDSGRIDAISDPLRDQAIRVEIENEALARGEKVVALLGDDDIYHCKHHRSGWISEDVRNDQRLLQNYLDHANQHYKNYYGTDPMIVDPMTGESVYDPMYRTNFMMLFGVQPPAPPPPPQGGAPGGPAASLPPEPGGPMPAMPQMPTNPATGQKFDTQTGGGVVSPPGA
jgi:hypothetical protein